MTDTDRPRRGPLDDDKTDSGKNMSDAEDASSSDPSSLVEKAADRLGRVQDAQSSPTPSHEGASSDQTSSIERFLNANPDDGDDALGTPGADPGTIDAAGGPARAEVPVSHATDSYRETERKTGDPTPTVAGTSDQQVPSNTDPVHPPETAAEITPENSPKTPPLREESENPYRAAHPEFEDVPPTTYTDTDQIAAVPAKRGLFRRKQSEPKPWHRDQAAEQPADLTDMRSAAVGEPAPEMPPKKRGVFGMIWGMVRFLLIGRKRPKKVKAPARQATPRRGPGLSSKIAAGLSSPRLGVFRRLQPLVTSRIGKVPGLRRLTHTKAEVVAEIERVAAETPAGIAEIAAETRRSSAGSHIQRPLDMSRRVGRSVDIDIEKIRTAGMVTPFGERTHIAEEFRLIKRPLLLNAFEKGANAIRNGNVIMVASSRSGEGKTFMAVNLAMSIASERDLTVLLIDADVAKPDIPNVLGFQADLGLVDLIADDQIDMSEVIMRTNIENLSVMPAGRPHHLATELLASERMGNLVSELSLRYPERVVIMDSPPALLSSVAGVLALNVGQTLFVVEAERTSQTAVDSAIGLVSACKNINLLLNKSRPLGGGERFGSYQSSYY